VKQSMRARRMAKHHRRQANSSKLNLVSLMDIFTILVFFLLINSGDVEVLQKDKTITLPDSVSEQKPDTTLIVRVNATDIMVGAMAVAKVDDVIAEDEQQIKALAEELQYLATRSKPLSPTERELGRAVTIMGDKETPYTVLKKIMSTCAANDYRNIALAVNKVSVDAEPEQPAVEG
jgi:biopolymer transport protein ExbD